MDCYNHESGIYIKNSAVLSQKKYFKKSFYNQPYLLVRTEQLENLPYALEDYCRKHGIPSNVYRRFNLRYLAQHKFILQSYNRGDNFANNVLQYPCANIEKREMSLGNFYCINLSHPLLGILKEELSKRETKPSPAFHEMSESDFALEYKDRHWSDEDYYEPETCESRNYNCYSAQSSFCYHLDDFLSDFQNIFDYRHLKD